MTQQDRPRPQGAAVGNGRHGPGNVQPLPRAGDLARLDVMGHGQGEGHAFRCNILDRGQHPEISGLSRLPVGSSRRADPHPLVPGTCTVSPDAGPGSGGRRSHPRRSSSQPVRHPANEFDLCPSRNLAASGPRRAYATTVRVPSEEHEAPSGFAVSSQAGREPHRPGIPCRTMSIPAGAGVPSQRCQRRSTTRVPITSRSHTASRQRNKAFWDSPERYRPLV